jgi:hypothetical protein
MIKIIRPNTTSIRNAKLVGYGQIAKNVFVFFCYFLPNCAKLFE